MRDAATADLTGQVVVTTGGDSELSRLVALSMLEAGAEVHCLVPANGAGPRLRAAAPADLRPRLTCHVADLGSLSDVKTTADAIRGTINGIDVLVDVTETFMSDLHETSDGIERTFAVNHLARFVLVNMLVGKLRARAPSRIVSLSSIAHVYHDVDPQDWETRRDYDGWTAYCRSKQADILFVRALARRLDPAEVTVNACDGGLQRDVLQRADLPLFARVVRPFIARTPGRVAADVRWLATAEGLDGVSGRYFVGRAARRPAEVTASEETQEALWSASLAYTGLGPQSHAPGGGLPVLR